MSFTALGTYTDILFEYQYIAFDKHTLYGLKNKLASEEKKY